MFMTLDLASRWEFPNLLSEQIEITIFVSGELSLELMASRNNHHANF